MTKDVDSMIIPSLREMHSEIAQQFSEVRVDLQDLRQRLDKLESVQKSVRQATSADTLMSKLVTGEFEDRIFELERKVESLVNAK